MIEFNLSVPREIKGEIISKGGDNFIIINSSPMGGNLQWFLINADEEEMIFLTLKFGKENVWKR